jgi:anti-sigma factor RsiW
VNAERTPRDETQEDFPADLVAYLDGELDATQTRAVEDRLSSDADYRRQLRDLQRAWDLLDQLPKAEVDDTFTQTTLAMVAVSAADDVEQAQERQVRTQRRWWWTGSIAATVAFAAGYVAVAIVVSRENRRLLRDLPVIQRLDEYRYADSVEFLRQLEREGVFAEDEIPNEI